MILSEKTLEKLRDIINGDGTPDYRSGPKLIAFFNMLGFQDVYGKGFPSRWFYTETKLKEINGKPELDKCIRKVFEVINYISRIDYLDNLIEEFNKYMVFDKWKVERNNDEILFKRLEKVIIDNPENKRDVTEKEFLATKFEIKIEDLCFDSAISNVLEKRLIESEKCFSSEAPLASILLIGSIMEGLFLGFAIKNPSLFNKAITAPKDRDLKVKKLSEWTLSNFIDVSKELGVVSDDVSKFSHVVRDFRNYIHPYQQMSSQFFPDKNTALICYQVLRATMAQIFNFGSRNKI